MARVRATHVDQGWAWVVLAAAFATWTVIGICFTNGVFNVIFLDVFGQSKQATAWICSTQSALWSMTAPIGSFLVERFGARVAGIVGGVIASAGFILTFCASSYVMVLMTFGVMVGTGFGISFLTIQVVIGQYFVKYRNLAYGLANIAVGLGMFLWPELTSLLMEKYGWRGAILIVGGIFLNSVACAATYRPRPNQTIRGGSLSVAGGNGSRDDPSDTQTCAEISAVVTDENIKYNLHESCDIPMENHSECEKLSIEEGPDVSFTNSKVLVDPSTVHKSSLMSVHHKKWSPFSREMLMVIINMLCVSAAIFLTYIHFPAYFLTTGASSQEVSMLLGVVGVTNVVSRLLGGVATTHPEMNVMLFHLASSGLTAITMFLCPTLAPYTGGRILFATCFGLYGNWCYSMLSPMLIQLFGIEHLTRTAGITLFVCGVGTFIGPPFAGFLYDVTGTYVLSFYMAGCLYVVSAVAIMLIFIQRPPQDITKVSTSPQSSATVLVS